MHLLITPKWDTDGESLKACALPVTVLVLNAPENADKDQEYLDNELGDALSDAFGFCHYGFEVQPVVLNNNRLDLYKKLSLMEAPPKDTGHPLE